MLADIVSADNLREPSRPVLVRNGGESNAAWIILGVLEFGVFAILVLSLLRLEILPHRDKSLLQVGLAVAMLTFAFLAFGQTATKQFAGTASLYAYFGATVVILILVSMLPPNRSDRWLGGSGPS